MTRQSAPATESVYRCAECGHGRHLYAYAPANVYGPVGADGSVEHYDDIDDYDIHEDSIECRTHPDGVLEKFVGGLWCRWWSCPECKGRGRTHVDQDWRAPNGYVCHAPGINGHATKSVYGVEEPHEGWRPVDADQGQAGAA